MDTFTVSKDVHGINLGMEDTVSAYLVDDDDPTLVETGMAASTDRLLEGIRDAGVEPEDLANVVIGHIHLDHSGGAYELVERAPELDVYLHHSMTSWLVDPDKFERLVESSRESLDEQFADVGAPGGVLPEENIVPVPDEGTVIDAGERSLEIRHTPGHSPDHVSVWAPDLGILFANEALGRYYHKSDVWVPPTTLPRFDPDGVDDNVRTLAQLEPDRVALSHFGVREDPSRTFERARERLDLFCDRIPELYEELGSLEATEERVADELLSLRPEYSALTESMQVKISTRCVLDTLGVR